MFCIAGGISAAVTTPLDVAKTRIMLAQVCYAVLLVVHSTVNPLVHPMKSLTKCFPCLWPCLLKGVGYYTTFSLRFIFKGNFHFLRLSKMHFLISGERGRSCHDAYGSYHCWPYLCECIYKHSWRGGWGGGNISVMMKIIVMFSCLGLLFAFRRVAAQHRGISSWWSGRCIHKRAWAGRLCS